jgi:hypothetical protein
MSESRRGRYSRQEIGDARGKAGQLRDTRLLICAMQGLSDARGKVGQMREARQGSCKAKRGKAWQDKNGARQGMCKARQGKAR